MLLPEFILGKKNYLCMGKYLDKLLRESFNDKHKLVPRHQRRKKTTLLETKGNISWFFS